MSSPFHVRNLVYPWFGIICLCGCSVPSPIERGLRHHRTYDQALLPGETALRWLGTAGYELRHRPLDGGPETVILIDPFFTRPGWSRFILSKWFNAPLESNPATIDALLRENQLACNRASCIFIGHGHFDHLMDAPYLALHHCPEAHLYGSSTVLHIAHALEMPENRLHDVATIPFAMCGPFRVTPVESRHAKLFGNVIYNEGELVAPPTPPLTEEEFKLGRQFNYLIEVDGLKIYHHGCADLIDDEIRAKVGRVDVLILGLALRGNTPEYLGRMIALTDPTIIIPTHHDDFFRSFRQGVRVMRHTKFGDFVRTIHAIKPAAKVITLDFFQELRLSSSGEVL